MKAALFFLTIVSVSISAFAEDTLKHCNLSFATPFLEKAIAKDISWTADFSTLKVTFVEDTHPNPFISRSEIDQKTNTFIETIITGSAKIRAEVTLKNGRKIELLRELFGSKKRRSGLPVTIFLRNKYYQNSKDNVWISNSCSIFVSVESFATNSWYYTDQAQSQIQERYWPSDIKNHMQFYFDDDSFDKNEPPYVH